MQSDKIKYTAKFNKKIYTQLIFFQYYRRIGLILITLGGIIALFITIAYILSWNPLQLRMFPFFAFFYSLFVLALPFILKRQINAKIDNHPLLDTPIEFEISENKFLITYHNQTKEVLWNQIFRISIHPKAWLIYGTKESFFYILKKDLSPSQQKSFIQWGQKHAKIAI